MSLLSPIANLVRSRPALRRLARAGVRLIPDVRCTMRVKDLGPIRVRLRRHRWFLWSSFAQSDSLTLGMFNRLIRPGDVVYDIGANIGLYTRVMRQWFQAGTIIAFEPMRDNFDLLKANTALGGIESYVQAFPIALSDEEGEEELQIDDMTSGTAVLNSVSEGEASVGRREFGLPPKSERVTVHTLDAFIQDHQLPPPQMMKIDTEGAEVKVLQGARQTLQTHTPRLVIALHATDKAAATLQILDELGYFSYGYVTDVDSKIGGANYRRLHAIDAEFLANNNIVASCELADVAREIQPQETGRIAQTAPNKSD